SGELGALGRERSAAERVEERLADALGSEEVDRRALVPASAGVAARDPGDRLELVRFLARLLVRCSARKEMADFEEAHTGRSVVGVRLGRGDQIRNQRTAQDGVAIGERIGERERLADGARRREARVPLARLE